MTRSNLPAKYRLRQLCAAIPALYTPKYRAPLKAVVISGNDRRFWKPSLQSDTSTLDLFPVEMNPTPLNCHLRRDRARHHRRRRRRRCHESSSRFYRGGSPPGNG